MTFKNASSNVLKGIVSLSLLTYFSIGFMQSVKVGAKQETCPDSGGWTKIDSGDLTQYPVVDATEYCFKAGSANSKGCVGGIYDTWPVESNEKICGLSHWSYYVPTVVASPEVSPVASPQTSPSTQPSPSLNPSPEASPTTEPSPETSPEVSPVASPQTSPSTQPSPSVNPTPTNSPSNNVGGPSNDSNNNNSNNNENRVLGASSDQVELKGYAATGMNPAVLFNLIGMVGSALVGISALTTRTKN